MSNRSEPPSLFNKILEKVADALYLQAPVSNATILFLAILFLYILENNSNTFYHLLWFLAIVFTALYRFFLYYKRNKGSTSHTANYWINHYTFASFLVGCSWGSLFLLPYVNPNIILYGALLMSFFGVTASTLILSASLKTFFCYLIPLNLSLLIALYSLNIQNASYLMTAIVIYFFMLSFFARNNNKQIIHSFKLQLENEKLILQLKNEVEQREKLIKIRTEKLENIAKHDVLTGLRNRLFLEANIEKVIEQYHKHNAPFAILMLDIDWFKKVNDNYGHDVGDYVLVEIAKLLKKAVRDNDKIYRSGGEEFVILLNRISFEDCFFRATKILKLMENNIFEIKGLKFSKTLSCGLYHSSLVEPCYVKRLFELTDLALYESKSKGRNQITLVSNLLVSKILPSPPEKTVFKFSNRDCSELITVNIEVEKLIAYSQDDFLINKVKFKEIIHPDDLDFLEHIKSIQASDDIFISTLRIRHRLNKIIIIKCSAYINSSGEVIIELQDAVLLSETVRDALLIDNFHAMLERTNDFIYFKDRHHVFTAASKTLVSVTSVNNRNELIGKIDYDVFPKELADQYFELEKQVFSGDVEVAQEIQPVLDKEGNKAWVDNRKYPIKDSQENIIGLFGIARVMPQETKDVTHQKYLPL